MHSEYYIAIDVGGTNCRTALIQSNTKDGVKILEQERLSVPIEYVNGISAILGLINRLAQNLPITGIGGSFAGQIEEEGILRAATNLSDWNNRPIKEDLEKNLRIPVKVFNDVAAAAMGEALYGHGLGQNNFIFMIWGTGVGGAKVEKLMGKFHITAFEPGHHIANPQGSLCACGLWGCPEMMIGGGPLSKKLNKDMAEIKDDDPMWDDVAKIAGQTVINTLAFHQTPLLVFGGGLIQKRHFLLDKISKMIDIHQDTYKTPRMVMTKLGDNAALYGTVALQQVELI